MAKRTFIPGILTVCKYLASYLASNGEKLKSYMGDGLYAVLVLVVDLAAIVAQLIVANEPVGEDPWTDFTAVSTLSSSQINQVEAAIAKFWATIGVTP